MSPPRLWSWHLSPFAGKVRIAAAFKGFELHLLEIDPVARSPQLRELNPTNRVPVLELEGGVAVRESNPICEWLEEARPEPSLWPAGRDARAAARGLTRWVDDELTTNFFLSLRKQAFGLDRSDHPDIVATLQTRLVRRWSVAERLLGLTDGEWMMGGAEPTLVDLAALPLAVRVPEWRPDLAPDPEACPQVSAWLEALRGLPFAAEVDRRGARVEPAGA